MKTPSPSLTNVQLELLKVFSYQVSGEDLLELKDTLAKFFAEKAIQSANQAWDEQGWDDQKVDELLSAKLN
ncbi:MAG: hypothetical protein GVY26_21115 [Bacteroidetes bacterium]|jgi:hypothetical protein|nr:hypothetical protein [Bacteroidota bacterium]